MKAFRLKEPVEDVKRRILAQIDKDNNEELDMEEFSSLFIDVIRKIKLIDKARSKFHEFDADCSGSICMEEARRLCDWVMSEYQTRNDNMSEAERDDYCAALVRIIDKNGDGSISLDEFAVYFDKMCASIEKKKAKKSKSYRS